ncbi:hypothetical protein Nepgr_005368 [Nepenthes gracilis]|uniref:Uncharacterized protein n=1 Tax=Nepenthes gracilis TaxID=150966 RepID=A0AAD3S332_NEPGR|nr:hypothetical protein Nepgr_005368 [Nepenthes gracilis]
MVLESRGSPSIGSQPMVCNPFRPQYPDIDFSLYASSRCDLLLSPSAKGDLMEPDSLGLEFHEHQFPSLQDAKRVSFKAKSGAHASRVYDDYCRELVGANQSVHNELPCLNINPSTGVMPDLESKQKGVAIADGGALSVKGCNEESDLDGSACYLEAADSNPVECLHGIDSKVLIKSVGWLPSDGSSPGPMDPPV